MKKNLTLDPVVEQLLKNYQQERSNQVQEYLNHPEKLPVFMDLRVDYAFKFILGHKPILLKLLNDVLPVEVSDIEYLPNEIPVVGPKEKRAVFDVICTDRNTNERFITEMQCVPDLDMDDRLLYYGSSLIHSQIERGMDSYRLKPVYVLCVANYERHHPMGIDSGQFFFHYLFKEVSHPEDHFSKNMQFFFLELPRLQKEWDKLDTNAERWCYLFGNLNNFAELPENQAGFEDVFNLAKTGDLSNQELKKYVVSMLDEYTIYTTTEYARREGYKEGEVAGKQELAKRLLGMGVPPETIQKASGLSMEAISALR